MAFEHYEESLERGQPIELYRFTVTGDPEAVHLYTNAERDFVFDGETYRALAVTRDNFKAKGRPDDRSLSVENSRTSEIAELFRAYPPGRTVTLKIRQGHLPNFNDPESFETGLGFPVIWVGRVMSSTRTAEKVTLTCESAESGMKKVGLRRHYQWACPLPLYGEKCRANKEAAKVVATTSSLAGVSLSLPPGWHGAADPNWFIGGMVEWDLPGGRERLTILNVFGGVTLRLSGVPNGIEAGDSVDVFRGCPHTLHGCQVIHNNVANYGGHPWIPTRNPVGKTQY